MVAFEERAASFEDSIAEIARLGGVVAASALASTSPLTAMQLAEGASDVEAAGRELVRTERAVIPIVREETARTLAAVAKLGVAAEWTIREQPPEIETLRIDIKAWFFFARALCDNVYGLLMARETGLPAPAGGSMSSALRKTTNPVAVLLTTVAPGWLEWFAGFRDKRNEIKRGVGGGITDLGEGGIGFVFHVFTPQRGLVIDLSGDRTISMDDLAGNAERLAEVLRVAAA